MLLAIERSGERVARYAHNVERMMNVPQQAAALLAVLMLRGPQTAGELRMNCERLHSFADIPAMEALLNELAARSDGALVMQLPPAVESSSAAGLAAESPSPGISELAAVKANVARLEAEVHELKGLLARVCAQLGIKQ